MKFPFVRRSRFEAVVEQWRQASTLAKASDALKAAEANRSLPEEVHRLCGKFPPADVQRALTAEKRRLKEMGE